jgi:hypothetical protein
MVSMTSHLSLPRTSGGATKRARFRTRLGLGMALLFVVPGILWPSAPAATTVVAPMTLETLSRTSDLVVHGKVESRATSVEGRQVFSYVKVGVTETLKGKSAVGSVVLKLYGGLHRGRYTFIVGAPHVRLGEEVVLFLKASGSSTYGVVGLAEGKFEVVRQGSDAAVLRDLRGIHFLRRGDPARLPESLEELKHAVRAVEG